MTIHLQGLSPAWYQASLVMEFPALSLAVYTKVYFGLDRKGFLFVLPCPHNTPFYPSTVVNDSDFFIFLVHIFLTINYYIFHKLLVSVLADTH